jgi:hypothetical protein
MAKRSYVPFMYNFSSDENGDRPATPSEACREYARNVGAERTDCAWILTDFDTWERNPYFAGPKCAAVYPDDEDADFLDLHAGCHGHAKCLHGFGAPVFSHPVYQPPTVVGDDDIPF